jgi:hypothetical protein
MNINYGEMYTRAWPPTAIVAESTQDELNDDGSISRYGYVKFINDMGAECIMTTKDFRDLYKEGL